MDNKRLRLVLLACIAVGIVVFVAVAVTGLSKLSAKSQTMVGLKLKSNNLNDQLTNLAASKKDIEQYLYFKDVAKTVLPNDKDQAQAVLDINSLANQSGILIQSISFPASSLGLKPTVPTTSTTSQDAQTAAPQTVISQAKPVPGISGLYGVELTITPQSSGDTNSPYRITYAKFLDFLSRLENDRRTAQITQVDIKPAGSSAPTDLLDFTLVINIFIRP